MILTILALLTVQADPSVDCNLQRDHYEMAECERADYQRADAALNQQWQLALTAARQYDRENAGNIGRGQLRSLVDTLRTAQRAWITYRDAHCTAEARAYIRESTHQLIQNICMRQLTETRTQQLASLSDE